MPSNHFFPNWMRWLAVGLAFRLAIPGMSAAQAPPAPKLKIVILEGEGAINNVRQRTARETIVQVQDENDRPIAGAVVIFTLPDRGASGTFANGARSMTVTTDAQGRAATTGFRPNNLSGDIEIQVTASYQGAAASTIIRQTNVIGPGAAGGAGAGKAIAIIGVIGGAAAAGAIYATRRDRGGTTTTPPPPAATTVSAGTPAVGPP